MNQSIQCQAQITATRRCSNKTSTPDGLCHRHKGAMPSAADGKKTNTSIPRVDGIVTDGREAKVNSGFTLGSLIPGFIRKQREVKKLKKDIIGACPDPEKSKYLGYYESMLGEVEDPEKLRSIYTLILALFPEPVDPHERCASVLMSLADTDNGTIRDLISAKDSIDDSYFGVEKAIDLRKKISTDIKDSLVQGQVVNFADHMKVDAVVREQKNSSYGYMSREGLARIVHENPDKTDEIIEYVRTHTYSIYGYRDAQSPLLYSERELQSLFIHNALDEGIL